MHALKFILALWALFDPAKLDCLPQVLLENLEYTVNATTTSIDTNSTVCIALAAQTGLCANKYLLNAKLYWNIQTLATRWTQIGNLGDALDALAPKMTTSGHSDSVADAVAALKNSLNERSYDCYRLLSAIQMGANCLIASGSASQYTKSESSSLFVLVDLDVTQQIENVCYSTYDALCLLAAGQSLSGKLKMSPVKYGAMPETVAACAGLADVEECTMGSCLTQKRNIMLQGLVTPFSYNLYPRQEFIDAWRAGNETAAQAQNRPINPRDVVVRLRLDPFGAALVNLAESAGVTPAGIPVIPDSAALIAASLFLILFTLLF